MKEGGGGEEEGAIGEESQTRRGPDEELATRGRCEKGTGTNEE